MTITAVFAALMCVCSWIAIPSPFSGVPFTLQTFAMAVTGLLLSPAQSALASLVYLLLGLAGMPVCAGFRALYSSLFSPTGGYLIGLLFAPFFISLCRYFFKGIIYSKFSPKKQKIAITVMYIAIAVIFGIVLIYLLGVTVLSAVTGMDFGSAVLTSAAFLPTDLIKCIAAAFAATALKKPLQKIEPSR